MPKQAEAVSIRAPRPRVYKSKNDIFRAHGAKKYYIKSVPPVGTLIGVPVKGGINWYEKDYNVRGYVLRGSSLRPGPAQTFKVPQGAGSLGQIAEAGDTATTIDEATAPISIPPPGHEWKSVGPAEPMGWNWKVVPFDDEKKFPIGWVAAGLLVVVGGILYISKLR